MTLAAAVAPLTDAEIAALRLDFPILADEMNGHPLAYLDSAATAQKPRQVLESFQHFLAHENAAVHRGAHTLAAEATDRFEAARSTVARFLGVADDEVVWTSGATAALNLVAYAIGNASAGRGGRDAARFRIGVGDEIVVTEQEHHANLLPWQELAARTGATLRSIPVDDDGVLDLDGLDAVVTERTRIVAFAHVSNVVGVLNPVEAIVRRARAVDALVVLDACQSAPHVPVDLRALDVDLLAFSGHKVLGPTGIGVLAGRREVLNALPPFLTGGSMITTVTMERADFLPAPQRFEAGTQPVAQAIGLAAAIDYLSAVGVDRVGAHEQALGRLLVGRLAELPGVRVVGPDTAAQRIGLAAFDLEGVHAHDLGQYLDDLGIAVRVGHHCAQPLHRRLGLTATTRASTALYTTEQEIDRLIAGVVEASAFFGAGG